MNMRNNSVKTNGNNNTNSWQWIVLAAMFFAYFIALGLSFNIGIYFVSFLNAFEASRSYTSWMGAIQASTFHLAGPICSLLLPHLGPRWTLMLGGLCLTLCYALLYFAMSILYIVIIFGVLSGFGSFFVLSGALATVAIYFRQERVYLASGIMSSGAGLGFIVIGNLLEYLLSEYGWRGSLLLSSGIAMQVLVSASLVYGVGAVHSNAAVGPSQRDWTHKAQSPSPGRKGYLLDVRFWFLSGAVLLTNAGAITMLMFLKDIVLSSATQTDFRLQLTSVGVGNILGRGLAGLISNWIHPPLGYFFVASLCGVSIFLYSVAANVHWLFLVLNFSFGFCHGQLHTLQPLIFAHVFGKDKMAIAYGFAMGFGSLTSLVGAPVGGLLADSTGNYDWTIKFLSCLLFASAICSLIVCLIQRTKSQSRTNQIAMI